MKKVFKSFGFALKGMGIALKEQQNMRLHMLAVIVVTGAGIYFHLSLTEWAIIAVTFGLVISAEMLNSAIEALVDMISPEYSPTAGKIKDIAAGAVLITAIVAVGVGVCVFGSKIYYWITQM